MLDLDAFMDPPALHLPIAGRDYAIACTAWQGLRAQHLVTTGARLDDAAERAEILAILGDTYQQMVDDGIGWPTIAHAGRTALLWFGHSEAAGQALWESAGMPGNPIPPIPRSRRGWGRDSGRSFGARHLRTG